MFDKCDMEFEGRQCSDKIVIRGPKERGCIMQDNKDRNMNLNFVFFKFKSNY